MLAMRHCSTAYRLNYYFCAVVHAFIIVIIVGIIELMFLVTNTLLALLITHQLCHKHIYAQEHQLYCYIVKAD